MAVVSMTTSRNTMVGMLVIMLVAMVVADEKAKAGRTHRNKVDKTGNSMGDVTPMAEMAESKSSGRTDVRKRIKAGTAHRSRAVSLARTTPKTSMAVSSTRHATPGRPRAGMARRSCPAVVRKRPKNSMAVSNGAVSVLKAETVRPRLVLHHTNPTTSSNQRCTWRWRSWKWEHRRKTAWKQI